MWRKGQAFLLGESPNDHPTRQSSNRGRAGCSKPQAVKAEADRAARNVLPIICEIQKSGSKKRRARFDWDNRDPFDRVLLAIASTAILRS